MNIELILYLINLLTKVHTLLICVIPLLFFIVCTGYFLPDENINVNVDKKLYKEYETKIIIFLTKIIFLLSLLYLLIPSEKTMYMMVGTHYLKNSTIPSKVQALIQNKLDDLIKENK